MLWVGERTRQLDHAHISFVRGINNPVGIKISDKATPEELLEIIDEVNPDNIPGRVTIIVRMGAEKLRAKLPILIRAVQREGMSIKKSMDTPHMYTLAYFACMHVCLCACVCVCVCVCACVCVMYIQAEQWCGALTQYMATPSKLMTARKPAPSRRLGMNFVLSLMYMRRWAVILVECI